MSVNYNVLGLIFASMHDSYVSELTKQRTMGSIPFGGRYRLIDFPLSNMVNSSVSEVGVITKSNYGSLLDHLGSGRDWDLSNELADYWANFMKTGNPNYEGKETWKPYEGGAYNVLEIAGEERRMISLADKTDIIQKAKELEEGK